MIPLVSKIMVFSKGTEYTPKGMIPKGGQDIPNSTVGDKAAS